MGRGVDVRGPPTFSRAYTGPMRYFPLAPMSGLIKGLTILMLALPASLLIEPLTRFVALGLGVMYLIVFLFTRPTGFEITPRTVVVVFPLWRREINGITNARLTDSDNLKQTYGRLLRVGVGGLWGGFGWLWSAKSWVEMYISRTDGYVLLERDGGIPLLITPERSEEVVRMVGGG